MATSVKPVKIRVSRGELIAKLQTRVAEKKVAYKEDLERYLEALDDWQVNQIDYVRQLIEDDQHAQPPCSYPRMPILDTSRHESRISALLLATDDVIEMTMETYDYYFAR